MISFDDIKDVALQGIKDFIVHCFTQMAIFLAFSVAIYAAISPYVRKTFREFTTIWYFVWAGILLFILTYVCERLQLTTIDDGYVTVLAILITGANIFFKTHDFYKHIYDPTILALSPNILSF